MEGCTVAALGSPPLPVTCSKPAADAPGRTDRRRMDWLKARL
jgi:hypothetical protein